VLSPHVIASALITHLPPHPYCANVTVAGGGFINFFLQPIAWQEQLRSILAQKDEYGKSSIGLGKKIHLEFVSSNPTGPLHVGHGRGAAYGSTLANLLRYTGFNVTCEYYVNDAGRQMNTLALSVWLRYLELLGALIHFPEKGYCGDYVLAIAKDLLQQYADNFFIDTATLNNSWPDKSLEADAQIDALILLSQHYLGLDKFEIIFQHALNFVLLGIKQDLAEFKVTFDQWFSEQDLHRKGEINQAILRLQGSGYTFEQDGAIWFRSTEFGDDKDRVLVRENGQPTYFAADVAHHFHTFTQGYDEVILIVGSDHHGYAPRVRAALQAGGFDPTCYHVLFVQFAILYRGKERVQMSTRSGSFVTLKELIDEIGVDSARYFYVSRKIEQHLDFDLEIAKSQSNDNPVYYIQYAHARICSVFKQLAEKKLDFNIISNEKYLHELTSSAEIALLKKLADFPDLINQASTRFEAHLLTHYLHELAQLFHGYYNSSQFLVQDHQIRTARLTLIYAVQQVFSNGLNLLNIHAPNEM
jgi:arginyl-tRNA synthetase